MWNKVITIVYLTHYIISSVESNLVPFITKCKWDDSKCLKDSAQKTAPYFVSGIPELNMKRLDPLILDRVDSSALNMKLIFTNITMIGTKNCEIIKIQRNLEKSNLIVGVFCPVLEFTGKYDVKGQLLVLPIEGNGDFHAVIRKAVIYGEFSLINTIGKDGKKHWSIKSRKDKFEIKEPSLLKFSNLYPNNEILRTTLTDLIDKNSNDLIAEFGGPLIKSLNSETANSIQNLFSAVPIEDLALD